MSEQVVASIDEVFFFFFKLQDNLEQPVTQSDNATDNCVNDDGDEAMDAGEDDAGRTSGKSASSRQNEKLYTEEGMLNTRLRKAEKKRRKKEKASTTSDMMDGDYDFKVDYFKKESIVDDAEDDMTANESKKNRFELPSGNELDDE